ncbi:MAG: hypothetical protein IJ437_02905 [Clostridia bacterium]|nr:hypothetical protein [Clostridia bacterium]
MEQELNDGYKKDYLKTIIIFTLVLIVALAFFYFLISKKLDNSNNSGAENDQPAFEETENVDTRYIVKDYNGKIGIYENDSLVYTLDTYIFTLPEKDKKLLSEGISVSSKEELYEILEEYY